jgi:hypothetical protein
MTQLSAIDLQPIAGSSAPRYATKRSEAPNRSPAEIGRRDWIAVVVFCAIGLIVTFGILTQVADYPLMVGQISLVP